MAVHEASQLLGNLGEFVGAIAVVVTLVYLSKQIRQNTKAMQSATFQHVADSMSMNSEVAVSVPGLIPILLKAQADPSNLNDQERACYHFFLLMAFRRVETYYIQSTLGAVDKSLVQGFDRSALSLLLDGAGRSWWESARTGFSDSFVDWVDRRIESGDLKPIHPGFGASHIYED